MIPSVYIISGKRTPIGSLNGCYSHLPAHELGSLVIQDALQSARLDPSLVDETIMGQVLTAGAGMNPARQAARAAGIPDKTTAFGVNQVCGSGLRAVALATQQILCADAQVTVAGGQESMSLAPHFSQLRAGRKFGDSAMLDTILHDGLLDAFYGYPMGMTAENIALKFSFDRDTQDAYALQSQQRAAKAEKAGFFDKERTSVAISTAKSGQEITRDEFIRHDASIESMAALKPVFKQDGTVTAANASGINDGAAALVLVSERILKQENISPMARIVSWASAGVDPSIMGLGPVPAAQLAIKKAGWRIHDVDLWEINEAFAAQAIAVISELDIDPGKVNVHGGAIALGHPIGASGARILVTLLHAMQARKLTRGVATLCIGGGMGIALCIESESYQAA